MRNSVQPAAYRLFDEDPFETTLWRFMQPSRLREERKEDIDLWPQQEPTSMPHHEKESPSIFRRRDPFKNVSQSADFPRGRYVSRSFVTKSHYDRDGKLVTERYASSAAGNGKEGIHEAKHLYSNSTSSIEKASHEQHLRGRSRLAVTEYAVTPCCQRESSQILHGMNETEKEAFGQEFDMNTKHLPSRAELNREALELPSHRLSSSFRGLGYGNRRPSDLLAHLE